VYVLQGLQELLHQAADSLQQRKQWPRHQTVEKRATEEWKNETDVPVDLEEADWHQHMELAGMRIAVRHALVHGNLVRPSIAVLTQVFDDFQGIKAVEIVNRLHFVDKCIRTTAKNVQDPVPMAGTILENIVHPHHAVTLKTCRRIRSNIERLIS
jgi:hypothetical protein